MKLKVFLAAVTSIGLLAGATLEEPGAQSEALLRDYPPIFELWGKGKEVCQGENLSLCVDVMRQVNQKIETLRDSTIDIGERVLLIATRALTASGLNVARAVSAVGKGDQDQACILLGNALLHVANASEALEFLPEPTWEEGVKEAVALLQASSAAQRERLRPLVQEACPSGEGFF